MHLRDLLLAATEHALHHQHDDGSLPAGINGPWKTPETPVRNTGHWLLAFVKAHQLTDDMKFRRAAEAAADYLLHSRHRPGGITFLHRHVAHADRGNGLIGQAWTLEALTRGGIALGRADMVWLAERCFLAQEQEERRGLWKMRDVDGTDIGLCQTLNQQLWFAAVGAQLATATGNQEISERVQCALDGVMVSIAAYDDGVFQHRITTPAQELWHKPAAVARDWGRRYVRRGSKAQAARELAIGYHSFCLYAIAAIAQALPDHPLPRSQVVRRALAALQTDAYRRSLDQNRFAWHYNVTGIENAFSLAVLAPDSPRLKEWWLAQQLAKTSDHSTWKHEGIDSATRAARIYECITLLDLEDAVVPTAARAAANREEDEGSPVPITR